MTGRNLLLCICAVAGVLISSSSTLASPRPSKLIVVPAEVHGGDTIYLSGGGLSPNRRLSLEIRCAGSVPAYLAGPVTDANGTFVAFKAVAPPASGSHRSLCRMYATARLRGKPLSGEIPGKYKLVPVGQPLSRCATHMCVKITAVLSLTQRGAQGNIVLSAWPGSLASATVVYPGGNVKYRGVKIGWQGSGSVRVHIAKRVKAAIKARVSATAVLGAMSGSVSASFIVLPNH